MSSHPTAIVPNSDLSNQNKHGKSVAVVVSRELFDRLSGNAQSLVEFMQRSPLHDGDDIVFERDPSLPREMAL